MTAMNELLWNKIDGPGKKRLLWMLWLITWVGLLAGLLDQFYYQYVVLFSAAHAVFILFLFGFDAKPFPAQVRIAYFLWVAAGTYVPYMTVLMYITTIGLATNLFAGYCPLARMLYLLPWNRAEAFSMQLVMNVFLTPPVSGQLKPRSSVANA